MKKGLIVLLTLALLFSFAACAGTPAQTSQAATATPQRAETASPEPTPEPTPTPEPVPESVSAFAENPRQYIRNILSSRQDAMSVLLSNDTTTGLFDTTSDDLINTFNYSNYSEVYDDTKAEFVNSDKAAQYDISLKFTDPATDWSNDFNYDALAQEIGMYLGLDYGDETITTIQSDGSEDKITQKWAQGSEDSYSASWIYLDSEYTSAGTARLTYVYAGQNEDFNALVSDSFSMVEIPFGSLLDSYDQTYSVGFEPNYLIDPPGAPAGYTKISYWYVSSDVAKQIVSSLSSDSNVKPIHEDESYSTYQIPLDSEYFDYMTAEIYSYGEPQDGGEPGYLVNYYIYF